jgi:hypothetical protein
VTIKDLASLPRELTAAVASVKQVRTKDGGTIELKMWDKTKNLETLARCLLMLTDRVSHELRDPALERLVKLLEGVTQEQARELLSVAARAMSSRHAIAALPPPVAEAAAEADA